MPFANILVDAYPEENLHRQRDLQTDGKCFLEGDILSLPFADKELDFVHCAHVLEHLENPQAAVTELDRVAARGMIVVPCMHQEAVARRNTPNVQVGHRWLIYRHRIHGLFFIPCRVDDREETIRTLELFDLWPPKNDTGYGAELRFCWGFGEWPKTLTILVTERAMVDGREVIRIPESAYASA